MESAAIPNEPLVITVIIVIVAEHENWGFAFVFTGYQRADFGCRKR